MPPLVEVVAGEEEERCGKEEALHLVQALIDSEEDVPGLVPVQIDESVEGDEEEPEMPPLAEVLAGEEEERCEEEEALHLVQALMDSEEDVPGLVPVECPVLAEAASYPSLVYPTKGHHPGEKDIVVPAYSKKS